MAFMVIIMGLGLLFKGFIIRMFFKTAYQIWGGYPGCPLLLEMISSRTPEW